MPEPVACGRVGSRPAAGLLPGPDLNQRQVGRMSPITRPVEAGFWGMSHWDSDRRRRRRKESQGREESLVS